MWLLRELLDRYPWAPFALVVAFIVGALLSGCASIPTEAGPMNPGLRVVARCPGPNGTVVLVYPVSRVAAGSVILVAAVVGAGIGAAIAGPVGAGAGGGIGLVVGAVTEAVQALWGRPDPVPTCGAAP